MHNWVFIIQVFGIKFLSFNYFPVEVVENAWMDVGSIDNCVQLWYYDDDEDDEDDEDTVLMMKGVELGEKKWNPRQLHCLLNLDNLSPGRADGKINWKWIWNAEIQICSVRGPAPEFSVLYRVKYRFWRAAALSANCWPRCTSPVHKSVGFRILSPHEESLHACLGFLVKV